MDSILDELENKTNKKWRTDYCSLLKNWALIKTSDLLKEIAYKELKLFKASDKAIHRLKSFIESNQLKSSYEQSVSLWKKAIDQFLNQKNYSAAAECLESLAEIELKYGKGDKKRDFSAIYRLKRASTYYRRSSDYKRAIIALRKAIIIAELNRNPNEFNLNFIETSYEECSHLYESIELHHLAKICRKNSNFFSHEEKLIANKEQKRMGSRTSSHETIPINTEDEHSLDFNKSYDLNKNCDFDSNSNSSDSDFSSNDDNIEKPKSMGLSIKSEPNCSSFTPSTSSCHQINCSNKTEEKVMNSKLKLLPQNLKLIAKSKRVFDSSNSESSDSDDSRDTLLYKPSKKICAQKQKIITNRIISQNIRNPKAELQKVRKRKLKPKENSEELPEKRLIKLKKLQLDHNFIIDETMRLKRLFCTVCEESIYSYRWSIVTDHLKSQKHKESANNSRNQQLTNEKMCETIHNNDSIPFVIISGNPCDLQNNLSLVPLDSNCQQFVSENDFSRCGIIEDFDFNSNPTNNEVIPVEVVQNCEEENEINVGPNYRSLDTPPSILKTPEPHIPSPLSDQ